MQARLDLDGFSRAVRAVALSPEANLMAGASNSREIKIWETMKGDELVTMKGHDGDGLCLCTMDESGACRCARLPVAPALTVPARPSVLARRC